MHSGYSRIYIIYTYVLFIAYWPTFFGTPLQIFLQRAMKIYPDLSARIRSLPRELLFGDLFSGTGCAAVVVDTLISTLRNMFPADADSLEDSWLFKVSSFKFSSFQATL